MSNKSLLVIALSARPFVAAAVQAGYLVAAIDGYADSQTVSLAKPAKVVAFDERGFAAEAMLAAIAQLDAAQYFGFVYGSGFEAQPDLLAKIAERIPLLGNLPATLASVKAPTHFFSTLAQQGIAHPKTWTHLSQDVPPDVLLKRVGGCGGSHIQRLAQQPTLFPEQTYAQQAIKGLSISMLFLANGQQLSLVGFNELAVCPGAGMPYRYGGAVSQLDLPVAVQQQMLQAAQALTLSFALLGLNSLDAIVQDGRVYVLEVNPRLSASMDLYDRAASELNLLAMHIAACQQGPALILAPTLTVLAKAKAQAVIYCLRDLTIAANFVWPPWVEDCPATDKPVLVTLNQAICTVWSEAADAEGAKQLLAIQVKMLNNLLGNGIKKDEHANND